MFKVWGGEAERNEGIGTRATGILKRARNGTDSVMSPPVKMRIRQGDGIRRD